MSGRAHGVVIHVNTLANPFVEAWIDAFDVNDIPCVVLANVPTTDVKLLPIGYQSRVVRETDQWKRRVEDALGSSPAAVFEWWGLGSLDRSAAHSAWPAARRVLCVDTYPNASRPSSEFREWALALRGIRSVSDFVVTSPQMATMLKTRFRPLLGGARFHTIPTPFARRSHTSILPPERAGKPSLIFTGRSDFLARALKRMAKDDASHTLDAFIAAGARVAVQRPRSPGDERRLEDRGYEFYPFAPRDAIGNGQYADMISSYDAHLVLYNVNNSTIARRVSTGLSTRFATGLCASAPMIVPREATFAIDFAVRRGFALGLASSVSGTLADLEANQQSMRQAWTSSHHEWTAEAQAATIRSSVGLS